MSTIYGLERAQPRLAPLVLRVIIVSLTLATAWIHSTLGGLLFTMNALGYTALAVAMVLPGPIGRYRWLVRLALIGFTLATIGGWWLFGAKFSLAYLDKGIEVVLVLALIVDLWVSDGGPIEIIRRLRRMPATIARSFASAARR